MHLHFPMLAATSIVLSGCFLTDDEVAAVAAANLNAGTPTFAETTAQPGGSFDQRIVADGITGFASDVEGNKAIEFQTDASFTNLTITFEDGTSLVLPAYGPAINYGGTFTNGTDTASYTQRLSDHVSLTEIDVASGGGRLTGWTAIGTQTALADIPTVGSAVNYNGQAFVSGPANGPGGSFYYDIVVDFASGTFSGTGSSSNPAIGRLDSAGNIVGNRLVGSVTLTPDMAPAEDGHLDGGFFRNNAEDIGAVFAIPSTGRTGYIFGRD